MTEKIAPAVSSTAVGNFNSETLDSLRTPGSLIAVIEREADLDEKEKVFLRAIPNTILEGIRALVVQAISTNKAVHLSYSPAYEFGLHVWDHGEAVAVHLEGPYTEGYERPNFAAEKS